MSARASIQPGMRYRDGVALLVQRVGSSVSGVKVTLDRLYTDGVKVRNVPGNAE